MKLPFGNPYRPPCPGTWTATRTIGNCHDERNDRDAGKFSPHLQGWPVWENVTTVVNPCTSDTVPPYSVPYCATPCSDGPERCRNSNPFATIWDNTYQLKDPAQFTSFSECFHKGFKVVYAAKSWFGMRGFKDCDPSNLGQTKYLTLVKRYKLMIEDCDCSDDVGGPCTHVKTTTVYERTITTATDRYTGQTTITCAGDEFSEIFSPAEFPGDPGTGCGQDDYQTSDCINSGVKYSRTVTDTEVLVTGQSIGINNCGSTFADPDACDAAFDKVTECCTDPDTYFQCKQSILAAGCACTPNPITCCYDCKPVDCPGAGCPDCGAPGSDECTDCGGAYNCECCDDNSCGENKTWELSYELSNPYTAAMVDSDCEALLATWNLSDDVQCPWRTDIPVFDGDHFIPNSGPAYGPLVTYNEAGGIRDLCNPDPLPVVVNFIKGAPISYYKGTDGCAADDSCEKDFQPWWNFERENKVYDCCDEECTEKSWIQADDTWGKASPYRNATQWMPDNVNNKIPIGSVAFYNSSRVLTDGCGGITVPVLGSMLVKSKYAEAYLHWFLSHNYARPCGDSDRKTVDPTYQDCTPSGGGYVRYPLEWPRDAHWPNAWTPTTAIPNDNQGSDASCFCHQNQAERYDTTPHSCDADARPAVLEKVLAPKDRPVPSDANTTNTPTKENFGYDDDGKKGDCCVKKWNYRPLRTIVDDGPPNLNDCGNPISCDTGTLISGKCLGADGALTDLDAMTCTQLCVNKKSCKPVAIFLQLEAPSGKYAGQPHYHVGSIALRDEYLFSAYYGELAVLQVHQVMGDPLWKEPQEPCDWVGDWPGDQTHIYPDNGTPIPIEQPLEECRDCADGVCAGYVASLDSGGDIRTRCEMGSFYPWTKVTVEIPDPPP